MSRFFYWITLKYSHNIMTIHTVLFKVGNDAPSHWKMYNTNFLNEILFLFASNFNKLPLTNECMYAFFPSGTKIGTRMLSIKSQISRVNLWCLKKSLANNRYTSQIRIYESNYFNCRISSQMCAVFHHKVRCQPWASRFEIYTQKSPSFS